MNPFNPTFGNVPTIFLDRDDQLKKVTRGLENFGSPYQTTLVYGLRGVGKTSFLTDVSNTMAKKNNWIVANLAVGDELIPSLLSIIYQKSNSSLKKFLDSLDFRASAFGMQLSAHKEKKVNNNSRITIENILKRLKKEKINLLVTIDEVQSTPEVKQFVTIYQLMRRENLPISLIMTGLPDKVSELQNEDVLTFLLRSARITLEPLDMISMKFNYKKVFQDAGRKINSETLNKMIEMTAGYAYAFQLLGYLVWENEDQVITKNTLNSVLEEYQELLFRNVYSKIYTSLSTMDKKFIDIMANYEKNKTPIKAICNGLNKELNYVSNYRRRLIDDQIITGKERGFVSFTLPYFADFIIEYGELY